MTFTTLQGTDGAPDSFLGTAGVDVIALQNQSTPAFLNARADADIITFTSFTQVLSGATLYGGQGNDQLTANNQTTLLNSYVSQNEGNDTINLAAVTNSTVQGNEGNDLITVAGLITTALINGNQGNDTLNVNGGAAAGSIFGGVGFDQISVAGMLSGGSRVQANEDDDIITIAAGVSLQNATINGNQGNDILLIAANSANPETRIYGGNGNDTLNATTSSANLNLTGDGGDDSIRGGLGNDRLTGGEGNDDIRGGDGDDTINGDDGNDTIFANQGNDLIHGGTGNDDIQAGQGDDSVDGGSGNDTIDGGTTGNDWLNGDTGNDTLTGSTGNDTLSGGSGNDDFIFSTIPTNGSDTITDFNLNQGDRMNISGTTVSALANTTAGTAITLNTTAELEDQLNPIAIASLRNFVARTANHTDIDSINDVVAALGNGGAMDAVDLADNGINTLVLSGADNTTTTYVYGYTGDGAPGYLANEFWLLATVTTNTTTFLASTFVY